MIEILKMSAFLLVVCAITAAALAFTDGITKERIAANQLKVEEEARKAVLGDLKYEKTASRKIPLGESEAEVFECFDASGAKVAVVLKGEGKGFGGKVEFILGANPKGEILGIRVISHNETPGLGTKVMSEGFLAQFKGLKGRETAIKKEDPAGRIDAITGVTVSSRAISRGVKGLLELVKDEFGK